MIEQDKVLACVDQSHFADHVTDYATWAAKRMDAPLELLHTIDRHPETGNGRDHSGAIGMNSQEILLTELTQEDEARSKAARETGRVFLNRLRQRAASAGVTQLDVRQRHGNLQDTLTAQENSVRLFVLGRRGESAEVTQRDLGRHVEQVVRALHKPILTVTEGFTEPRRILIAFDGGIITRRGVEMVAASPLFKGLPVHLLMSGAASDDSPKQLDWAVGVLRAAGFEVTPHLLPGDTERVIAQTVKAQAIDLLIMGAYAHSFWRSWLLGSKTTDLLRSAKLPTLLLR